MTLSKTDLGYISKTVTDALQINNKMIYEHIFRYIDITCPTKQDVAQLNKKIANLPNKREFFEKMDK